jgi:hypothetical protein
MIYILLERFVHGNNTKQLSKDKTQSTPHTHSNIIIYLIFNTYNTLVKKEM